MIARALPLVVWTIPREVIVYFIEKKFVQTKKGRSEMFCEVFFATTCSPTTDAFLVGGATVIGVGFIILLIYLWVERPFS